MGHRFDFLVRPYRSEDAEALSRIFHDAVCAIDPGVYSRAQLEAWSPAPPAPDGYDRRAEDGRLLLVAVDAVDRPVAYGDLEPDGHLDHLYRDPSPTARGAASAVYERLETVAREWGLPRLFTESSEPARTFFTQRGFRLMARRDFLLRGVPLHNHAMEKRLCSKEVPRAPVHSPP